MNAKADSGNPVSMKRRLRRMLPLAGVLMLACSSLSAGTYYVSLEGDDTKAGTTEAAAFRTIEKGVSILQAGDTLIIKSGDYGDERVVLGSSGRKGAPITIKAEKPGEVVLTGRKKGAGLTMIDKSHVVVEGLKFTRFGAGLVIKQHTSYITVRKCIFLNNENAGIVLNDGSLRDPRLSHHHLFTENQFLDYAETGQGSPTSGGGISDYGLRMYFSSNVEVVNNYFYGHHHQCLSFKEIMVDSRAAGNVFDGFYYTAIYLGQNDDTAVGYPARSRNLIAEGNVFRPTGKYRAKNPVVVANVTNAIVRNNFVDSIWGEDVDLHDKTKGRGVTRNFPGGGIHIAPSSTGAKVYGNVIINSRKPGILVRTGDCEIYNNTVAGCDWGMAIVPGAKPVVRNNVFYRNKVQVAAPPRMETWGRTEHTEYVLPDGSVWKWHPETSKRAIYENNDFFPSWAGMGKTDISADPRFVGPFEPLNTGEINPRFVPDFSRAQAYRLGKDSPCIDKGVKTGLSFTGQAPDLGAFESGK